MNVDATRGGVRFGILHRVVGQGLNDLTLLVRGAQCLFGALIEVEIVLGHNDVNVGNVPQFAQFQGGELHLRGASATKDMHVSNRVFSQALGDVFGDFSDQHVFDVLGQDTRNIQCNISDAQHGNRLCFKRPGAGVIRMPVVPRHEIGSAVGLRKVNARDIQWSIAISARGDNDRIVMGVKVLDGDVATYLNVSKQANIAALKNLVEGDDNLLDSGVVRGNAVAHQAVGGRKAFEQIDIHVQTGLGQNVRCINARRACADNGNVVGAHA